MNTFLLFCLEAHQPASPEPQFWLRIGKCWATWHCFQVPCAHICDSFKFVQQKMKYWGLRDGSTVTVTNQLIGLWGIVVARFGHSLAVLPWWPPSTNMCDWSRGNPPWSMKDIPMKLSEHWNRSASTPGDLGCTNCINKMVRSLVLLELLGSIHVHRFKTKGMYVYVSDLLYANGKSIVLVVTS